MFRYLLCPFERYRSAAEFCRHMNRALKKISEMDTVEDKAGEIREKEYNPLFPDLSTYWSRHTWATIARQSLIYQRKSLERLLA